MTPDRRAHILAALSRIHDPAELEGFREQLSAQGELRDAEVFRAVSDRVEFQAGRRRHG